MKTRITALALAAALVLGLAACAKGQPQQTAEPAPSEAVTPAPGETTQPSESAEPEESAAPEGSAQPSQSAEPIESAAPTEAVIVAPNAPLEEPSAEPASSEEPAEEDVPLSAAQMRELFVLSSSNSDAPTADFSDMSGYLDNFYNLNADDLEDFVFYMPDMSTALQEFFLAKAKPGKVEDVKAACESRLAGLKEEAEFYAGTGEFVENARLETVGDWVVLAACPEADRMVKILQDSVK